MQVWSPKKSLQNEKSSLSYVDTLNAANINSFPMGVTLIHWPSLCQIHRKTSCISRTKSQNLNVSRLVLQSSLPNPLKPGVKYEDVVGAAPTGDAPTTSEWSTILLHYKVRLLLEVLR